MPFGRTHYTGILDHMCGQGGRIEELCCTGHIERIKRTKLLDDRPIRTRNAADALALMPQKELSKEAWFYRLLLDIINAQTAFIPTMKTAGAMAASAPPEQLDIRQLIEKEDGLDKLDGARRGETAVE